jgi:predicted PurR-regulated permease PerM
MSTREQRARTVFAWVLLAVLTVVGWYLVRPFLSWLLATGLLAFVLTPAHRRLEERIGSRPSAALLVVGVLVLVVAPLVIGVEMALDSGISFLEEVSEAGAFSRLHRLVERTTGIAVPIEPLVDRGIERARGYTRQRATTILRTGLHAFVGLLVAVFVLYYLLADGRRFVRWLKRMTPLPVGVRDELFESVDDMTWAVLKGHVLVALVQGAVAGVPLFLTGVPHALSLTVAMMFLAIVPIIGVSPVLGGAIVYLVLQGNTLPAAFVFVWGFTAVAITDDYLRAELIDHESEMHSAVVLIGVAGGAYLLGAMGLFVGPILIGLLKVAVEVLGDHYDVIHRSSA